MSDLLEKQRADFARIEVEIIALTIARRYAPKRRREICRAAVELYDRFRATDAALAALGFAGLEEPRLK